MVKRLPPVLSIPEIFGIFLIVLIIQFSLDIFQDKTFWIKYLGAFLFGLSFSAFAWIVIARFFGKHPKAQDILVIKPWWFYIILIFFFFLSLYIYFSFV